MIRSKPRGSFWSFFQELLPAVQCLAVIRALKILRCSASLYLLWQINRNLSLKYGQATCTITVERQLARLVARTVMRRDDAITTSRKSWSPFIQPVPGFEIVACGVKLENGKKNKEKEGERGRNFALTPYPTPCCFFCTHLLASSSQSELLEQELTLLHWQKRCISRSLIFKIFPRASEMLAMEMKTSGMYVSRGLSFRQAEVMHNLKWHRNFLL